MMNPRLAFVILFTALCFMGCASMQLKKGQEYYENDNCSIAFEYFKKAPENPRKNKALAKGLIESATCLARQRKTEAENSYQKSIKEQGSEEWHAALTYIEKALSAINVAIDFYREAALNARYHEDYSQDDIDRKATELESWHNRYLMAKERIDDNIQRKKGFSALEEYNFDQARSCFERIKASGLRKSSMQIWKENKCNYLKDKAKSACEAKRFVDATFMYEKAIALLTPEEDNIRRDIQGDLISMLCQAVRHYISIYDWIKAQDTLNKLSSLSDLNICTDQIKKVYYEFKSAHEAFRIVESQKLIREGRFQEARSLLKILAEEGNKKSQQILRRLDLFESRVSEAVAYAAKRYTNLLDKNLNCIDPQVACSIRRLRIGKLRTQARSRDITNWLSEQGLEFEKFRSSLVLALRPHYDLDNNQPDAWLSGICTVVIKDKEQWIFVMDMWLEGKAGTCFFRQREKLWTGKYKIFNLFGNIRKQQKDIVEASLKSLFSKLHKRFIPFGRCKDSMITDMAMKRLSEMFNKALSPDDHATLKIMIERKVQPKKVQNLPPKTKPNLISPSAIRSL